MGSAQTGRCQYQTMADYEQWCKYYFSPRQKLLTHPIVDTLSWGPPRSKPLIPEQRTQQLTTPYTNMTLITLHLSVILAFHSVEKCYWDHRWRAAAPRSQTHLKRKRWAPLFSAAWLYKSCSAPKTNMETEWSHITVQKLHQTQEGDTLYLHTHTHKHKHFLACSNS